MRGDSGYAYLPAGQAEVEFAKCKAEIRQLEHMNATLVAEIDQMSPVVQAAQVFIDDLRSQFEHTESMSRLERELLYAVNIYRLKEAGGKA